MRRQDDVIALHAAGKSVRAIAAELGLSRSMVHRTLHAQADAPDGGASVAVPAAGVDLTSEELAYMRWSEAHVAGGLNALELYRLGAVLSFRLAGGLPEREVLAPDKLPKHVRDARILELRAEGESLARIGELLGMSKGGVSRALARIEDVWDEDDLDDVPSVPARRRQRFGGASRAGWRDTTDTV